jgi:phosphohistidine phosphatase
MIVTILRHGEAATALSDRERQLTSQGVADVTAGCHRLVQSCRARQIPLPDALLYSAWLRTTQTADIAREILQPAKVEPNAALLPGSTVCQVDSALSRIGDDISHLVLVSHQPLVSRVVDHYLGDDRVPGLYPGGLAVLSMDVVGLGCAELLFWSMPPNYEMSV